MEYNRDNDIARFIREKRKEYGYTQVEFAINSGLGLRFVRELEQGKLTLKMDKVLHALSMFDSTLTIRRNGDNIYYKPPKEVYSEELYEDE